MRLDSAGRRRRRLIGLTPLIDVVFILLLFFMLAANLSQWREISVQTPTAGAVQVNDNAVIRVRLAADGSVQMEGIELGFEAVLAQVAEGLRQDPQQRIVVQLAADTPLQIVIDCLEALQALGGERIALQRAEAAGQ